MEVRSGTEKGIFCIQGLGNFPVKLIFTFLSFRFLSVFLPHIFPPFCVVILAKRLRHLWCRASEGSWKGIRHYTVFIWTDLPRLPDELPSCQLCWSNVQHQVAEFCFSSSCHHNRSHSLMLHPLPKIMRQVKDSWIRSGRTCQSVLEDSMEVNRDYCAISMKCGPYYQNNHMYWHKHTINR